MRNTIKMLAWGIAGLTLTGVLTFGAFAIAGRSLSSPSAPLKMVVPSLVPTKGSEDATHSPRPSRSPHDDAVTRSPSTVVTVSPSGGQTEPPRDSQGSDPSSDGGDNPAGDD